MSSHITGLLLRNLLIAANMAQLSADFVIISFSTHDGTCDNFSIHLALLCFAVFLAGVVIGELGGK